MKQALPPEAQGKPVEIWFQDEARVGQQGTLTRVWARRGTRPPAPRDRRYDWAYLFGAICPGKSKAAAIVMPHANMDAMNEHFAAIAQAVAKNAHAILVLDGAGWHTGKRLKVPANITLLPLPPYSPELNPAENVWQYLRQNQLANVSVRSGFQLPTNLTPMVAPNSISMSRDKPFHMTMLPGGGSLARAR